ncbi:glutamate ABC transporter substrate-binding protein [Kitasatospora viridis]
MGQGRPAPSAAPTPAQAAADPGNCDTHASPYRPSQAGGPTVDAIKARGYLIAGIDLNDYEWGFLGPDGRPQGFDVDIVNAIAQSLFGRADPQTVHYVPVDDDQRIPRLRSTDPQQHVDLVVHTMTVTCQRQQQVAFSTVYYQAGQRVLVPKAGNRSDESGPDALKGKRVCTAVGSTSADLLAADARLPEGQQRFPGAVVHTEQNELDCLARDLQQHRADAVLTDDAIAYGLAAQDPETMVVGAALTEEPYAVAMPSTSKDLVAWVNQVLEDYRSSGQWKHSYETWLLRYLPAGQPEPTPPPAVYAP